MSWSCDVVVCAALLENRVASSVRSLGLILFGWCGGGAEFTVNRRVRIEDSSSACPPAGVIMCSLSSCIMHHVNPLFCLENIFQQRCGVSFLFLPLSCLKSEIT